MTLPEVGLDHEALRTLGQHPHVELAVLQWRVADPQRQIKSLLDDVDTPAGGFHFHLDIRVLVHEAHEQRPNQEVDHPRRTAQPDMAPWLGVMLVNDFLRGLRLDQHRPAMAVVIAAQFGDGEAAR